MCLFSQPSSVSSWGNWESLLGASACTVMASAFSIKSVYLSAQITLCKNSQWCLIILRIESKLPGLNNPICSHFVSLLISFFSFLNFQSFLASWKPLSFHVLSGQASLIPYYGTGYFTFVGPNTLFTKKYLWNNLHIVSLLLKSSS